MICSRTIFIVVEVIQLCFVNFIVHGPLFRRNSFIIDVCKTILSNQECVFVSRVGSDPVKGHDVDKRTAPARRM